MIGPKPRAAAPQPSDEIPRRELAVRISGRELGRGKLLELRQPFAVIGRSSNADISLGSSRLSFRHAYLQVLDERVLCIDLKSKTGLSWGAARRPYGWLSATDPVRFGPYKLRLASETSSAGTPSAEELPSNPLDEPTRPGMFPQYGLEFFDDAVADSMRPIDRRITLIGRDANCAVRLDDPNVSRVHCALVLEREGLWVVDLLGKEGIRLDGQRVQIQQVQSGSELVVGNHTMAFWRREPVHDADTNATFHADSNPALDISDTTPQLTSPFNAAPQVPAREADPLAEWGGTLFAIEYQTDTLVVMPKIKSGMFRYAMLQLELNALRFKLLRTEIPHLVVDLSELHYAGSEVMCAVVALARQTETRGGQIALCSPTGDAQTALARMGLSRIWTLHSTRAAAIAALHPQ